MSKQSFKELKERFKQQKEEQQQKKKNNKKDFNNSDIYPFWEMKDGEEAIVRILPDANKDNPNRESPFPISVEYKEHTLSINGKDVKIPDLNNWGQADPIAELSQKYYKAGDKEKGKYYWRSKINLLRALIIKDPLPPDENGINCEGKTKTLRFGFQLMETLLSQIASDDIDVEPWDLKNGYNFRIKKTAQGDEKSTYAIGSGFVRNPSSVEDYEIELVDLATLLPPNPGRDKVERLLDAHLTGSEYTEDKDSIDDSENTSESNKSSPKTEKNIEEKPASNFFEALGDDSNDDDDDIIAKIKARKKQKEESGE